MNPPDPHPLTRSSDPSVADAQDVMAGVDQTQGLVALTALLIRKGTFTRAELGAMIFEVSALPKVG